MKKILSNLFFTNDPIKSLNISIKLPGEAFSRFFFVSRLGGAPWPLEFATAAAACSARESGSSSVLNSIPDEADARKKINTVPTQFCYVSQFCYAIFEPRKSNKIETASSFNFRVEIKS